jgi:hypothetical protein
MKRIVHCRRNVEMIRHKALSERQDAKPSTPSPTSPDPTAVGKINQFTLD